MWKPKETKNEHIHAARSGSDVTTCHLNSIRGISKSSDVCAQRYITTAAGPPFAAAARLVREEAQSHALPKCIDDVAE